MTETHLTNSHFRALADIDGCDITVGELLREVTTAHPKQEALVEICQNGSTGRRWTYALLSSDAERRRLDSNLANGSSSGRQTVQSGC